MKSELELLKEKVNQLEEIQRKCIHDWQEVQKDTMDEEIYETKWVGVDCFSVATGKYRTVECWSRTCSKCGKKEYTKEIEEVAVKTEQKPKFK